MNLMFPNTDKTQLELISTEGSWTGLEKKAVKKWSAQSPHFVS